MHLGKDPMKTINVFADLWTFLTRIGIKSAGSDPWRDLRLAQRIVESIDGGVYNEKDI